MIESFISSISDVVDTIAIFIQYFIHALHHIIYFLGSAVKAVRFIFVAIQFLPVFFIPIVSVVVGVMIIRAILGRE